MNGVRCCELSSKRCGHRIGPRVCGAVDAIEFYKNAFGATEKFRLVEPGGRVGHEIEKLDPKEMQRRYTELTAGGGD